MERYGIDVLWIPLGAGGWFVRLNGRVWEALQASTSRRKPSDLYHTALIVHVPQGRFTIENAWPVPDSSGAGRGVVAEGPVFSPLLGRLRAFRYEVRCWPEGVIFDAEWAAGGPRRICDDIDTATRVLEVLPHVPTHVWGRTIDGTRDMWNSNSTISWALTRSGLDVAQPDLPPGGRAPGWQAGIAVAHRERGIADP